MVLHLILDGRNSNVSGIALGYVRSIVQRWSAERGPARSGPALELVERSWFNPNLDSRWFIVRDCRLSSRWSW